MGNEGGYTVLLEHSVPGDSKSGVIDFTLLVLHEHEKESTVLYLYKFEHTSIIVARELARRFKEHVLQPDIKLNLWLRALAKEMGFEVDFSKGLEYFSDQVASRVDTEHLELYIQGTVFEPFRIVLENELKKRSLVEREMQNV